MLAKLVCFLRVLVSEVRSRLFGTRTPSRKSLVVGVVAGLRTSGGEEVGLDRASAVVRLPAVVHAATGGPGGNWVEGAGGSWKRVQLTSKTPSSSFFNQVWVALRLVHIGGRILGAMFKRRIQVLRRGGVWNLTRLGLGNRTTGVCTDSRL